jgi:hypothetical protein
MTTDKLFFGAVKEDRGWYYVEYQPPHLGFRFAVLSLVVPDAQPASAVAAAMEAELKAWLLRYPVPLMVSAFDGKGDLFSLEGARSSDHLMGYTDLATEAPVVFWRLLKDEEIPGGALGNESLVRIYGDVPYKTSTQTRQEVETHARQIRRGWMIVFLWVVVGPAVWAILEWASPAWLGVLVLGYSLWQAVVKGLKLSGKWKESPREIKAREEDARMRHHHYHCERNPEGFLRLKVENFDREERDRIRSEAMALKATGER